MKPQPYYKPSTKIRALRISGDNETAHLHATSLPAGRTPSILELSGDQQKTAALRWLSTTD
jgi:hypothetical protein